LCGLSGQRVPVAGIAAGVPAPDRAFHDLADLGGGHLGRVIGRAKPATAPPACASGLFAQHRIGQLERYIGALARAPIQLSAECPSHRAHDHPRSRLRLSRKAAILAAYCHDDTPDLRTIFVYGQAPEVK
jgi:hypothetical protein